jgi:indolepyruvate ferredoxin oxidoreductase alpha subunit
MGASIGMAKGAAEAGVRDVVATIGDSTFLHSGIPALIDAAEANTPMTVLILDNSTVAMTGGQPTATTSERISGIVEGLGVDPDHIVTLKPTHSAAESNADMLRRELDHPGLSVIVARRACVRFPAKSPRRAG